MKRTPLIVFQILILLAGGLRAAAQGTAFTYQGRLSDGANPVNGIYDFTFTVWTVPTGGGTAIGPALVTNGVPVSNGVFTVVLDFGPDIFTGPERWLES